MLLHARKRMEGTAGMGILAALMIVSVITAVAVKQSWRSELDLTRSGHRWLGMQARAYAQGAEELASIALKRDAEETKVDSLDEPWAEGFEFPTDHGSLRIRIIDAQSKLNLNALGERFKRQQGNGQEEGQPLIGADKYSEAQRRFIRLVQTIPLSAEEEYLDQATAEALLEALKDWVDQDNEVSGFNGAEGDYYEQLDPPITISNGPMVSVTELIRIKGMLPALYQGLLPHVSVLGKDAPLNINTIGPVLARSINSPSDLVPLSAEDGESFVNEISSSVPETAEEINDLPILGTLFGTNNQNAPNIDLASISTSSSWFELDVTVLVGDHVLRSRAMLQRADGKVRVVRRSDANF